MQKYAPHSPRDSTVLVLVRCEYSAYLLYFTGGVRPLMPSHETLEPSSLDGLLNLKLTGQLTSEGYGQVVSWCERDMHEHALYPYGAF